jgi:hypothetical protein
MNVQKFHRYDVVSFNYWGRRCTGIVAYSLAERLGADHIDHFNQYSIYTIEGGKIDSRVAWISAGSDRIEREKIQVFYRMLTFSCLTSWDLVEEYLLNNLKKREL